MVFGGYAREVQLEGAELAGLLFLIRSVAEERNAHVSVARRWPIGALGHDGIQQARAAFGSIKVGKESQHRGQYSPGRRMTLSVK
jgi:hypothetical protein